MSLWEPFTEPARQTIVRAQQVAQMFAASFIGTEHIAFALGEGDDAVARIVTETIDRDRLRELLGGARQAPRQEMVFTQGAKRTIELAFENARRLGHDFIATAHLAQGMLQTDDGIPIRPGVDLRAVNAELGQAAVGEVRERATWTQTAGTGQPHAAADAILSVLHHYPDLRAEGTQVSVTIAPPGAEPRTWTWTRGVSAPS